MQWTPERAADTRNGTGRGHLARQVDDASGMTLLMVIPHPAPRLFFPTRDFAADTGHLSIYPPRRYLYLPVVETRVRGWAESSRIVAYRSAFLMIRTAITQQEDTGADRVFYRELYFRYQ